MRLVVGASFGSAGSNPGHRRMENSSNNIIRKDIEDEFARVCVDKEANKSHSSTMSLALLKGLNADDYPALIFFHHGERASSLLLECFFTYMYRPSSPVTVA